eukprot:15345027-Ditylum_brightwellii.AAC.1
MVDKGYIPEHLFDQLGYHKDSTAGKVFECNQGIEAAWMHYAKILTHKFQKKLKEGRERKLVEEFEIWQEALMEELIDLQTDNKTAEKS